MNKNYKYKIGDTIEIRSDLQVYEQCGNSMVTPFMKGFLGKTATITDIHKNFYLIDIDNGVGIWTEEMFIKKDNRGKPIWIKYSYSNDCEWDYVCPYCHKSKNCWGHFKYCPWCGKQILFDEENKGF